MKRLANFKSSAAGTHQQQRSASFSGHKPSKSENELPLSRVSSGGHLSFALNQPPPHASAPPSAVSITDDSDDASVASVGGCKEVSSVKSRPAPSATTATTSAFSSPTPSVRSLSTTLTTIQSTAPGSMLNSNYNPHPSHHHNPNGPPVMYSSQFPQTPSTNGTVPPTPQSAGLLHPVNYSSATAGGILTDNASIITLASSSKRRRRSMDTDASVRALAPSSIFGGSRESLPLSVLSANLDSAAPRVSVLNAAGNRESLQLGGRASRRSSGWGDGSGDVAGFMSEEVGVPVSVADADARSISEGACTPAEARSVADGRSVADSSSNVAIWHGIVGKREGCGGGEGEPLEPVDTRDTRDTRDTAATAESRLKQQQQMLMLTPTQTEKSTQPW